MATLFISDLHVDAARPDIGDRCLAFLAGEARDADALYILGDLFEAWVGDDDPEPEKRRVIGALAGLSASGVPLYFMHGNRDFLVGSRFADETGCEILPDPSIVEVCGQKVLLTHGDMLCTDDTDYLAFRSMVRNPLWQKAFLARGLEERLAIAQQARRESLAASAGKPAEIMDVNADAVEATIRDHGIPLLLHGHTHRPAVHQIRVDGKPATRIVLGDWYTAGSVLVWDEDGYELRVLPA